MPLRVGRFAFHYRPLPAGRQADKVFERANVRGPRTYRRISRMGSIHAKREVGWIVVLFRRIRPDVVGDDGAEALGRGGTRVFQNGMVIQFRW